MKKNVGEWKYYLFIAVVAAIVLSAGVYYNIVNSKDISTVLQSYPEYKVVAAIVLSAVVYYNIVHYKDISTVLQSYPEYKCELSEVYETFYSKDLHILFYVYNLTFLHSGEEVKISVDKVTTNIVVEPTLDKPFVIYKCLDNDIGKVKKGFYVLKILIPEGFDISNM